MSAFGEWTTVEGLPAFEHRAGPRPWDRIIDPPTSRHWVHLGRHRHRLFRRPVPEDARGLVWPSADMTLIRAAASYDPYSHSQPLLAYLRLVGGTPIR